MAMAFFPRVAWWLSREPVFTPSRVGKGSGVRLGPSNKESITNPVFGASCRLCGFHLGFTLRISWTLRSAGRGDNSPRKNIANQ